MDSQIKEFELKKFIEESFNAFQIYKNEIDEHLNVTLGNVSCDMDSCIGAILLGFYLTLKNDYIAHPGDFEKFWLPIINCPRAELKARLDIAYHLKKYDVEMDKLVFIDDINLDSYAKKNLLKIAMIDHNELDVTQKHWGHCVTMIVDHHKDEKAYLEQPVDRTITFCGSACSLVVERIFRDGLERFLSLNTFRFFMPAILLDTENFKPSLEGSKWSQIDKDAIFNISRLDYSEYYNDLVGTKFSKELNIQLELDLILKKDYKNYEWNEKRVLCGISVVFNPLHEILFTFSADVLKQKLQERMKNNNLSFYAIIAQFYLKGTACRELMLFDLDGNRLSHLGKLFAESKVKHTLKKFTGLKGNFLFFALSDESISRKKLEPVLREIFDTLK